MSNPLKIRRQPDLLARVDAQALDRLRAVVRRLKKDDSVKALLRSCNQIGEAYLFGGLVRDALLGSTGQLGDVDIFVSGPINSEFAADISRVHRRTNFGGMRLVIGRFDVDIWELEKSQAFRYEKGPEKNVKGLLGTVVFSTDAVAVSLLNGHVLADTRFNVTARTRVFGFVARPEQIEILQVVRACRIAVKNGVQPDLSVSDYISSGLRRFGIEGLIEAEAKWRGRRVLDQPSLRIIEAYCDASLQRGELSELAFEAKPTLFPDKALQQSLPIH